MSNFTGMMPSYVGRVRCVECNSFAVYEEYIVAEGYPDAHTEWEAFCPECGHVEGSLDE